MGGGLVSLTAIEEREGADIQGLVRKLILARAMPKEIAPNYLTIYPPSTGIPGQYTYFLGHAGPKEVGIAIVRWSNKWTARIPAFGVYPDYRKEGYGRALATALFEEIHRRGYERVTGLPVPRSRQTTSLYKKIGVEGFVQGVGIDETYSVDLGSVPETLARLKAIQSQPKGL